MTEFTQSHKLISAKLRRIRVKKEDSAFVYSVLESHGDIVSFSTVNYQKGSPFRDLELSIPPEFSEEADLLMRELGDIIYELKS